MPEDPKQTDAMKRQEALRESETSREAAAEGETAQDFDAEREPADSHTAFGDDKVTPRLNDGR